MGVFGPSLLLCLLLAGLYKKVHGLPSSLRPPALNICEKQSLGDVLLVQYDYQCLADRGFVHPRASSLSRVAEVNVTTVDRALTMLPGLDGAFAAVLFYADWCPFSRALRPMLDSLSMAFPTIYHFAVKDSALQPSALPQFGVHSFPVLFLHNKTTKVRYQGPRTFKALSDFYKDATGFKAVIDIDQLEAEFGGNDRLSYPWQKARELWLHDDVYLALATAFLVLRLVFYLVPKLLIGMKYYLSHRGSFQRAHKILLGKLLLRVREQGQYISSHESFKARKSRKETGKGVLSVPSWSSSSLAAVSLAEASTSRSGGGEIVGESGHAFRRA